MNGSVIFRIVRMIFGVLMVVVYIGMAIAIACNYFDWSNVPVWKIARWCLAIVFFAYGIYRAYRQIKGIDYYRLDRFKKEEDETKA